MNRFELFLKLVLASKKEKPRFVAGSLTLKYLLLVYLACGAAEWMQKLKLFLINTTTADGNY